ncbi:hypothetical protein T03_17450 [Trichinella britovi]|uniref:Uncharacterized protein n=1 Tax=Trichinella britovi TaxID=45882 RepID=A0A0V1BBP8_TRIBR|nr:hypothetical protein T03_17450 [Trichinella britovi]
MNIESAVCFKYAPVTSAEQSSTGTTAHPYPHLVLFRYNAYL